MTEPPQAPFPWFGGKSRVAPLAWARFGTVANYVEPFFGSGAVLLGRPDWQPGMTETINDKDGYVSNFWRAIQAAPEDVACWADWPVNENDLHARHAWLVAHKEDLVQRLEGDPAYYDAQVAGWWVWGICSWIGGGWCSGAGPWHAVNGRLVKDGADGKGINRRRPHTSRGMGINRRMAGDRSAWLRDWFTALQHRLRHVCVCSGD